MVCHLLAVPLNSGFRILPVSPPQRKMTVKNLNTSRTAKLEAKSEIEFEFEFGDSKQIAQVPYVSRIGALLQSASYFLLSSTAVSVWLPPPAPLSPLPSLLLVAFVLGVLVFMPQPVIFPLGPVSPAMKPSAAFDDPSVPLASLFSRRGP